jgi:hypothetical protein
MMWRGGGMCAGEPYTNHAVSSHQHPLSAAFLGYNPGWTLPGPVAPPTHSSSPSQPSTPTTAVKPHTHTYAHTSTSTSI